MTTPSLPRLLPPLLALAAASLLASCSREPEHPALPVAVYLQNPAALPAQTYRLDAVVLEQIASESDAAILLVAPTGDASRLPLYLASSRGLSLHPGQTLRLTVAARSGVLHLLAAAKL